MSRKDAIIQEAARLFEEKGFKATSMRDLAFHVGIEASSLYSHISSKQNLLKEICFQEAKLFQEHIESVQNMNVSDYEKLKLVANFHIDSAYERITSSTVFNNEWMHLNELDRIRFIQLRDDYEIKLKSMFLSCMKNTTIKEQNVELTIQYFLASFKWIYYKTKLKSLPKEDVKQQLINLIFNGLAQA